MNDPISLSPTTPRVRSLLADRLGPQAATWATADRLVVPDSAAYDALLAAITELVDEGERIAWSMGRRMEHVP